MFNSSMYTYFCAKFKRPYFAAQPHSVKISNFKEGVKIKLRKKVYTTDLYEDSKGIKKSSLIVALFFKSYCKY